MLRAAVITPLLSSPLSGQSRSNSMDSWVSAASATSLHNSRGVISPAGEKVSVEEWLAEIGAFPSNNAFSAVENEAARRYQVRQGVSAVRPYRSPRVPRKGWTTRYRGTLPVRATLHAHSVCVCERRLHRRRSRVLPPPRTSKYLKVAGGYLRVLFGAWKVCFRRSLAESRGLGCKVWV